jgi:hypothetical protein
LDATGQTLQHSQRRYLWRSNTQAQCPRQASGATSPLKREIENLLGNVSNSSLAVRRDNEEGN